MSNSSESYYNSFYKECAELDARGASFKKISSSFVKNSDQMQILDVGCGSGAVSKDLVKSGHQVSGIEFSDPALAALAANGIQPIKLDLESEWHLNKTFDAIFLLDVLEHVFDPIGLLGRCKNHLKGDGYLIVSVPLYFDLIDRLRILFTGQIVSYDNLCYGSEIYSKFRSFNYDHIRFFHINELHEMFQKLNLHPTYIEYQPWPRVGPKLLQFIFKAISNKYTCKLAPSLLAHSVIVRLSI